MCFHLYLASPLTLSEVRSMLPKGLGADLIIPAEQRTLKQLHPDTQTVARLVRGACSCDLVVQRHPVSREDEAWLRRRYREQGLPRTAVLAALERHRRAAAERAQPAGFWPRQVAEFVVEHGRNAGPTLYYLHFSHDGTLGTVDPGEPPARRASEVRMNPEGWLPEEKPVLVLP
ncbi:MAG TPA: hypothetical protein VH438_03295 [Gemmatimonadales bacterium]|jgi:hypothetical protein